MSNAYIFLLMVFLHIVDDYYLQRILASMKQKGWWEENAPQELYKYDYIWALIMHSFSWAFMVMLPVMFITNNIIMYLLVFIVNLAIHAFTDHVKANLKRINLWVDQLIHIGQIICTFLIFFIWM